jgi:bifunctional non-homologous end joining protein LigD
MKYDGYRCLLASAAARQGSIPAPASTGPDKFPEIAEAAAQLEVGSALLDGEIVSLDEQGRHQFSALQAAISGGGRGPHLLPVRRARRSTART